MIYRRIFFILAETGAESLQNDIGTDDDNGEGMGDPTQGRD